MHLFVVRSGEQLLNEAVKDSMEETIAKGALFKMASSPEPGGELKPFSMCRLLEALS